MEHLEMKVFTKFLLAIAFGLIALSHAVAQPATQPKPQTPPATQAAPANVPIGKVAVIFSAAFQDPKEGIAKFTVLLTKLNAEFQKTQDDLNQMGQKINQLQDEIAKLQKSTAP